MDWRSLSSIERSILNALSNGSYRLTDHALKRMRQRTITTEDIKVCAETATGIHQQELNQRYMIMGVDTLECEMTVIAEVVNDIVVISLW